MICEHNCAADGDGDYNDDDIHDDGNLIMHDCVYRDDDECDDHRYAAMCQLALLHIFLEFFLMTCFCIVIVECTCVDACACAEVVYGVAE